MMTGLGFDANPVGIAERHRYIGAAAAYVFLRSDDAGLSRGPILGANSHGPVTDF
jgi:hypothetical protein